MRITVRSGQLGSVRGGVQVFGALEGDAKPERVLPGSAAKDRGLLALISGSGMRGELNTTAFLPHRGHWVLVVGLGKAKDVSLDRVRQFAATAARTARARGQTAIVLPVLRERQLASDRKSVG